MTPDDSQRWYHGITRYQWLVLVLASAGWVFDVYEGQIFNITRDQLLADILGTSDTALIRYYGDVFLGIFLAGGTLGGIAFGMAADYCGRRPMLIATILTYSLFSGLTFFAETLEQIAILRFLVAVGVGGEWSVAASLVAEEFPPRARAQAGSIFHATSIIGTWLAGLAGLAVGAEWRYAYLLGVLPAVLVVFIRLQLKEPSSWQDRQSADAPRGGNIVALFADRQWATRAILGLLLASIGLGTFWCVTVAGQGLTQELLKELGYTSDDAQEHAKFAYSIVQATGGGVGLLAFGPLAARWGRRAAFLFFQVGALAVVPLVCYVPATYAQLLCMLPIFGFFTLGMHAGFAIYFPELFPTSLRATASGFCFNGGRVVAASMLFFSGWLKSQEGIDLRLAVTLLSLLFVPGVLLVWLLPETKGQPLPE